MTTDEGGYDIWLTEITANVITLEVTDLLAFSHVYHHGLFLNFIYLE